MKKVLVEALALGLGSLQQIPRGFSRTLDVFEEAGYLEEYEDALSGLPPEVRQQHRRLLDWFRYIDRKYLGHVQFRLIDPHSLTGLFKSLRYRVWEYPAFVIGGQDVVVGWNVEEVESLIQQRLRTDKAQ